MKITIITEFDAVPAAAAFLARVAEEGKVIDAEVVETVVTSKTAAERPARKPRSDAGQPRGEYKPRATTTGEPAASEPGVGGKDSASASQPAAPATPTSTPSAPEQGAKPASAAAATASTGATATAPAAEGTEEFPATLEGARKAMKALDGTKNKGMEACIAAIKAYGVNRITDLPKEKYGEFIKGVLAQCSPEGLQIARDWAKTQKK